MAPRGYSTDEAFNLLGDWVVSKGGFIHDSLVFVSNGPSGTTMRTTASLDPNSKILTCPHLLCIDYFKARSYFSPSFVETVTPRATLYAFLCAEWLQQEEGFWWPYLRILPREFNTPLYFSQEDMQWLQGCNLGGKEVDSRRELWKNEWKNVLEALERDGVETEEYTWELFLWAATVFSSRSFPGKLICWTETMVQLSERMEEDESNFPVLFPLLDALNHLPNTKITWQPSTTSVSIISGDTIAADNEVLNNYGPKPNEELLMGYGFTLLSNPADTVRLKFLQPLTPAQCSVNALQVQPQTRGIYHLLRPTPGTSIYPLPLLVLFHLLTATLLDLPTLQESLNALEISLRNTIATHSQLLVAINRKLSAMKTDNPTLTLQPSNQKQFAAEQYRDGQIFILQAAVEESEEVLKNALGKPGIVVALKDVLEDAVFLDAVKAVFFPTTTTTTATTIPAGEIEAAVRSGAVEDLVFVLYICWKWIHRLDPDSEQKVWKKWFERLETVYPREEEDVNDDNNDDDGIFESIVVPAAETAPAVFGGNEWSRELVVWAMKIYQYEGVDVMVDGVGYVVCLE